LCLFLHHHLEWGARTSFTRWCDPPGGEHRQLARQVGVLRVSSPISHRFPDGHSRFTIPPSTVIWFEILEFMSTGFGYDMILI